MAKKTKYGRTTIADAKASSRKAQTVKRKAKREARVAAGIVKAPTKKGLFVGHLGGVLSHFL